MKATFLFLVLVLSISCNRNTNEEAGFEVQQIATNESIVNNETKKANDNLVKSTKNDSTEKVNNQRQNKTKGQTHQQSDKKIYNEDKSKNPLWNWWMIIGLSSLTLNLFFIFRLVKSSFKKEELRSQLNELKNEQKDLKFKILNLESENNKLKDNKKTKISKINAPKKDLQSEKKQNLDDEKSPEISLSVENSNSTNIPAKKPTTLYAEKADDSGVFSQVSEVKDEYKSIFKFSLKNMSADTAYFEILNSEYILKMVANSPDIYLYMSCKPENSNQNFTSEIVTKQKGIAENIDGQWRVKKGNKAIIKFQ